MNDRTASRTVGPQLGNLFAHRPAPGAEEHFDTLLDHPAARVERILSHRHASPPGFWYDQPGDEWVVLVAGAAVLEIAGPAGQVVMGPGDWVFLPAGCRHRVAETGPETVWLALHLPAAVGSGQGAEAAQGGE